MIAALAAVRRVRRVRLYFVAVVMAGVALVAQLVLAVLGFALVLVVRRAHPRASTSARTPSWTSIALALSLATLAYTGLETVTNFAAEVREPGRTMPRSLFLGIGAVVVINVAVSMVGISAYPVAARRGGARRRGERPRHRLAAGAAARDRARRSATSCRGGGDVFVGVVGVAERADPDHGDRHRDGRGRAARLLDGPLRHAAPRLRPARARVVAHRRPRRSPPR